MATGVPPAPAPSTAPQGESSPSSSPLSWEGDKMFNIYIYDYCYKRGFRKTAHELLIEAEIASDSTPPINARQGLLFEWWSVFWVLFTAKSSGTGSDDALLYTQHQAQLQASRQLAQRSQPQQPLNRYLNGLAQRPGLLPNGQLPNGVGQNISGAPSLGATGPSPFPIPGTGPQPNGMVPTGAQPALGPSSAQQGNYSQMMPGQRPPQQRHPNGVPPFQSPILAHSPQNPGVGVAQHPQAPMGQLGPSPHMGLMNRGPMLPPNSAQGMTNPIPMGSSQQVQTPGSFQQRPASRAGTPSQNPGMTQPSPSLAARQPGMSGDVLTSLPQGLVASAKQEAGLGDKDINALTPEEKQRVLHIARQRSRPNAAKPGPSNGAPGPSGINSAMQPPNARNPVGPLNAASQRMTKRSSTSPGEEPEMLPRSDASPPDRKRARRSPMDQQQLQGQQPMTLAQQQASGVPAQLAAQAQNGLMRPIPNPMAGGFSPQAMGYMGNNPALAMQMGQAMGPQATHTMSPAMTHPGAGGMLPQQMAQYAPNMSYRHPNMQGMPGMPKPNSSNTMPGNIGSPASTDPSLVGGQPGQLGQFPGPGSRMGQNNKPMGMMPPPSPGMNGPKDQASDKKPTDGSPRNAAQNAPGQSNNQSGTAPPTPGTTSSMTDPSPSSVLGVGGSMNQPGSSASNVDLFSTDFIQSVASGFDEFDPNMFSSTGTDRDLNFERDFGQWFNPDDVGTLEMK